MAKFKALKRKILDEIVRSGEVGPGEVIPSYERLVKRFGGSTTSVMMAVGELEREGVLYRLSPRKIAVAAPREEADERVVGLIGMEGHVFGDLGHALCRRLCDRNIFSTQLLPLYDKPRDIERWFARFFQAEYRALVIRDSIEFPVKAFCAHRDRMGQLILVARPDNAWPTSYNGAFLDLAFPFYDGLSRLYAAGHRRIHLLHAGPPLPHLHHRDRWDTGVARFLEEVDAAHCDLLRTQVYTLYQDLDGTGPSRTFAASVRPGDALLGCSDYAVIKGFAAIHDYAEVDLDSLVCIGMGNTPWSQEGPYRFASYDYRVDDLVDQVLEWIDTPPAEPTTRRIRPKLAREERIRTREAV